MHSLFAHDDQALGLSETEDESRLESLADEVLAEAIARSTGSRLPVATYRLQLCAEFTLAEATEMVGYLAALGVSDVYASPLLQAMPGSPHGYDVVDHQTLNAEIGTLDEYGISKAQGIAPFNRRQWFDLVKWAHSEPSLSRDDKLRIVRLGRLIQTGRRLRPKQEEQVAELVSLAYSLGYKPR